MAKKDTGCSGSGFFDTFSIHRHNEYTTIAPKIYHVTKLTDSQQQIAQLERMRVYEHAALNALSIHQAGRAKARILCQTLKVCKGSNALVSSDCFQTSQKQTFNLSSSGPKLSSKMHFIQIICVRTCYLL
jgi:hypothetical protein